MESGRKIRIGMALVAALAAGLCSQPALAADLTLNAKNVAPADPDDLCFSVTETQLQVNVDMTDAGTDVIVAGQFFMGYDDTILTLVSVVPGDVPFTVQIAECSTAEQTPPGCPAGGTSGEIDYAVGAAPPGAGTKDDTRMAVILFNIIGEACPDVAQLVSFRAPPAQKTVLVNDSGDQVVTNTFDLGIINIDLTEPTVDLCPEPEKVECDANSASAFQSWKGTFAASDNCDTAPELDSSQVFTPACGKTGSYDVDFTAEDDCGNVNTDCMNRIFAINDTVGPKITCPPTGLVEWVNPWVPPDPGSCTAGTVSDKCNVDADCDTAAGPGDGVCGGKCSAPGASVGNLCDVDADCDSAAGAGDGVCEASGRPTAADACATSIMITKVDTSPLPNPSGDPCVPFLIERTWKAEDPCGNFNECVQIINIEDTTQPSITCPPDVNISCGDDDAPGTCTASNDAAKIGTPCANNADCDDAAGSGGDGVCTPLLGIPSASDNCTPNPSLSWVDTAESPTGNCPGVRTKQRLWTAIDDCGLTNSCQQTITINDTSIPSLTLPANATIECDESIAPSNTGQASATDDCGPVTPTFADTDPGGTCRTISRVWTADDGCNPPVTGTQTIAVIDSTPPIISIPIDTKVECDSLVCVASDDAALLGTSCGIDADCDDTAGGGGDGLCAPDPVVTGAASGLDNCGTPAITFVDTITAGTCADSFTIARTWTATNDCGGTDSGVQTIEVNDSTDPLFTSVPADTKVECDQLVCTAPPANVGNFCTVNAECDTTPGANDGVCAANTGIATATDNCGPATVTFTDQTTAGSCPQSFTITRTWQVEDDCGNTSLANQTIEVNDTTAPVLTLGCPADITTNADAGGCDAVVTYTPPAGTDNCGAVATTCNFPTGSTFPVGTTTVLCAVHDECLNSTKCQFDVTVNPVNTLNVDIEIVAAGGVTVASTHCITFELFDSSVCGPPTVHEEDLSFDATGNFSGSVEVACGAYDCITARDRHHSLRRTDEDNFAIVGPNYEANFTGFTVPPAPGDDALILGNFNDLFGGFNDIDILDWAGVMSAFNTTPGPADCTTVGPHYNIDGLGGPPGLVWLEEVNAVSGNFWVSGDANCCGLPAMWGDSFVGPPIGPVRRISVKELRRLGLIDLIAGDLNHDGWLDEKDIEAFGNGARP